MAQQRSKGRNVHGIVLLNKPVGITSNGALQRVKRLFNARKAGHTGSLDPIASGLLPICLGEATKISGFLLDASKAYRAVFKLGVRTNTGDADGAPIAHADASGVNLARINEALQHFIGEIEQTPPMYSALKQQGIPLYKLARQGIEVERQARKVTIHALKLLRFEGDEVEVAVRCSKGTYIRTLAEDVGGVLGCGAHVSQLERAGVGGYVLSQAVSLEQLETWSALGFENLDRTILPSESALAQWPEVKLTADAEYYLQKGQAVFVPRVATQGWVRLFTGQMRFLGVGQVLDDGRVAPKRLLKI